MHPDELRCTLTHTHTDVDLEINTPILTHGPPSSWHLLPSARYQGTSGDGHLAFRVVTWLSRHGKMSWEPWQRSVTNGMGAMAKRRPWQTTAMENVMAPMAKKVMTPLKGILSGPELFLLLCTSMSVWPWLLSLQRDPDRNT